MNNFEIDFWMSVGPSVQQVASKQLDKLSSKRDIYDFLAYKRKIWLICTGRSFLPAYRKTTMVFLK